MYVIKDRNLVRSCNVRRYSIVTYCSHITKVLHELLGTINLISLIKELIPGYGILHVGNIGG